MVLALLTTSVLSIVCFIATSFMGITAQSHANVSQHITWGLSTAFLVTLAQSMTMFYFIGTGKIVKDYVASRPEGNEFIRRTKVFKAKAFPPAMWAMMFTMATFILGGAVHTKMLPGWAHGILAVAALYYNFVATWRDAKYMMEHSVLMEELEKALSPVEAEPAK